MKEITKRVIIFLSMISLALLWSALPAASAEKKPFNEYLEPMRLASNQPLFPMSQPRTAEENWADFYLAQADGKSGSGSGEKAAGGAAKGKGEDFNDASGNDPRDFGSKLMPYYSYTKLENDVEVNSFTMFGFLAFNARFGMTYELPLAKEISYSDVDGFKTLNGNLPSVGPNPGAGGGGIPFADLESDGDVNGMGDLGLRFFFRPKELEWTYMGGKKNFSILPVVEFTLPTATDDLLGGEALIVSPGFVLVFDLPFEKPPLGLAFVAMMNFYDFDAYKDNDRTSVSRYRGRWFYQQPLSKPAFVDNPSDKSFHVFDLTGLYVMPEFQPVYDFENNDFSFWIAPEFGKVLREGTIVYFKPGWGVDNSEDGDRTFTFEFGFRYFM